MKDTTIIIQCYKNIDGSLHRSIRQALEVCEKVIIYNDGSSEDFSKYKNMAEIVSAETFSGKYETCLAACLPLVTTKYVMKMNAGDNLVYTEEPKEGYDIFLARYTDPRFSHNIKKDFHPRSSSSFISGSVIPTEVYIDLVEKYSKLTNNPKKQFPRFGMFCGDVILNSDLKYYLPEQPTYEFTYNMWGGQREAFSIK